MKILTFSPEYPPLSVGGLARHVQPLSEELVRQGHEVTVITQSGQGSSTEEVKNGVKIVRVNQPLVNATDFTSSILQINFEMIMAAGALVLQGQDFDIIHGHDWLVIQAARALKHQLKIPLLMTIHATEQGRNHGIWNEMQRYINDLEWLSCYEAWRVIVCSDYMKHEIQNLFQVPRDKIDIIENGVSPDEFQTTKVPAGFKKKYAHPNEKIVFFVGRLVQEKGVQVLVRAIPEILSQYSQVKFVIGGKGPKLEELKAQAKHLGVADRCYFTGFISDEDRNNLYRICDLAVFPSLYEPFGIVALEGMAAEAPVLITDVGGMGEIIEDGVDGIKIAPNSPHELAQGVLRVLKNPALGEKIRAKGYKKVENQYTWPGIAKKTDKVYQRVLNEYLDSTWGEEVVAPRADMNHSGERIEYRYRTK